MKGKNLETEVRGSGLLLILTFLTLIEKIQLSKSDSFKF